jgi:hypothetical protein
MVHDDNEDLPDYEGGRARVEGQLSTKKTKKKEKKNIVVVVTWRHGSDVK